MKSILSFLLVVLFVYIGICVFLFLYQRSMIYYPVGETDRVGASELRFDTGAASIKMWRVGEVTDHAVLYFGGNAEDVSQNIPEFANALPNHTVYLVNYRGYGGSTGSPSEEGLNADALSIFDHLVVRHDTVSVVGRSLGSGVATYLAAQRQIERLVLVTPFDSLASLAEAHYRLFPISLILLDRFDSIGRAGRILSPTLVVIAEQDEIIPRRHTDRLIGAIVKASVDVEVIPAATHNTIGSSHYYMEAISTFVRPAAR